MDSFNLIVSIDFYFFNWTDLLPQLHILGDLFSIRADALASGDLANNQKTPEILEMESEINPSTKLKIALGGGEEKIIFS